VHAETAEVSSTEIRRALAEGDVAALVGKVPSTTLEALKLEFQKRLAERRAGEKLLGATAPTEKSFAALLAELPASAPNLLAGLDERSMPDAVRQRLANLQARVNKQISEVEHTTMQVDPRGADAKAGFTPKLKLLGRIGNRISKQYLFKKLSPEKTKRVESLTLLSNLVGVPTPIATPHTFREKGARFTENTGVVVPWIGGLTVDSQDVGTP
jgi:hypothetical protein